MYVCNVPSAANGSLGFTNFELILSLFEFPAVTEISELYLSCLEKEEAPVLIGRHARDDVRKSESVANYKCELVTPSCCQQFHKLSRALLLQEANLKTAKLCGLPASTLLIHTITGDEINHRTNRRLGLSLSAAVATL